LARSFRTREGAIDPQQFGIIKEHLGLKDLKLFLDNEVGSTSEGFRSIIRQHLVRELSTANDFTVTEALKEALMDLEKIPECEFAGISVSHCRQLGGFFLCMPKAEVGFDIEEQGRISEAVLRRVCRDEEFEALGVFEPSFLWVAKEATIKAARKNPEVKVYSDTYILGWEDRGGGVYSFDAQTKSRTPLGVGVVFSFKKFLFGIVSLK
jgi:hypothetical protein